MTVDQACQFCGPQSAKRSEVEKHKFKIIQKGTDEGMMGVLARNLVQGRFYSLFTSRGAGFGLVGV
jgi:hypothetical protein